MPEEYYLVQGGGGGGGGGGEAAAHLDSALIPKGDKFTMEVPVDRAGAILRFEKPRLRKSTDDGSRV